MFRSKANDVKSSGNEVSCDSSDVEAAIVHIGSRGGYVPFTFPKIFDPEIRFVVFDAADDAVTPKVLLSDGRVFGGAVNPLQAVVSSSSGEAIFFNTACAFASGLKPFNPAYRDWYSFGNGDIDYILGEAHKVLQTEVVTCCTLDSLSDNQVLPDTPTILSIDAQGVSLEIISGGHDFIARNVHVIICEVELINFYEGAPSFSEILKTLSDWGFLFFGFLPSSTTWASPVRRPIGQRGRTHRGSEDAIFIRDVRRVVHLPIDSQKAYVMFCHLVGSVEAATHIAQSLTVNKGDGAISLFVRDVRDVLGHQKLLPSSFADKQMSTSDDEKSPHFFKGTRNAVGTFGSKDYPLFGWSRYEKVLRKWGMRELARTVRSLRRQQSPHAR